MQLEIVSMQIVEFRTEMEEALSWRKNEIVTLKNLLREDNKAPVVKTLIVMLYAHFEGFFKDCLECYVKYINSTERELSDFNNSLKAASLSMEYAAFEDMNRKCKELTEIPPAENFLHRFHRRKELTEKFVSDYLTRKIRINDEIINTKSNLSYNVVQENMYILGLDYNYFSEKEKTITKLVRLRNSVAHGSQRAPIEFAEYEKIENDIFEVMEDIIKYLFEFCSEEKYLKA